MTKVLDSTAAAAFHADADVRAALDTILARLAAAQSTLDGARPACDGGAETLQSWIDRSTAAKGRGPIYPYVGSGIGRGPLVELVDGSVKWDMINGIGVHMFWHYVGNRMLTLASNVFTNLNLTDMETCYKVFRKEFADRLDIQSRTFAVEPEITAKVAKMRERIYEVPISYAGRDYSEGKKIGPKDAVIAIWAIMRWSLFGSVKPAPKK